MVNKSVIIGIVIFLILVNFVNAYDIKIYYPFSETNGTTLNDFFGISPMILNDTGILDINGSVGSGIELDGTYWGNATNHTNFYVNSTEDLIVCVSVNMSSVTIGNTLFHQLEGDEHYFDIKTDGTIEYKFKGGGAGSDVKVNSGVLTAGIWYNLCAYINEGGLNGGLYIDGILEDTDTGTSENFVADDTFYVFKEEEDCVDCWGFHGIVDEFCYYVADEINFTQAVADYENNYCLGALDICIENWTATYTACNISDNKTLYYVDENSCGTNMTLPIDNGTIESCNYCSADFECTLFDGQCGDNNESQPLFLDCTNVTDYNYGSCCSVTNLTSDCNYSIEDYQVLCGDINVHLVVPYYPYVDLNSEYEMNLYLMRNGVSMNLTDFMIDVGGDTFNFTWDSVNEYYDLSLVFTERGDYPFTIYARYPYEKIGNITGTLIVREPCYITFEGYTTKNQEVTGKYDNDFAYIIAEKTEKQYYDKILEKFITPLLFKGTYKTNVFYAPYTDGEATLKLWDNSTDYAVRLVDGNIAFDGQYSVPNITETYYTNIFLDIYDFDCNGKNETLKVYFSNSDVTPYRSLFNWVFVIGLGLIAVISIFMFFVIPEYSQLSVIFGLGFTLMLVAGRIVLFFVFGW